MGVRPPLCETEQPIVQPYWLVKDIKVAVAAAKDTDGQVAIEPTEAPDLCTFAICWQSGVDDGFWQE